MVRKKASKKKVQKKVSSKKVQKKGMNSKILPIGIVVVVILLLVVVFLYFSGDKEIGLSPVDRENIKFKANGDDKMDITFTDHRGKVETFQFAKDNGNGPELVGDDNGRKIVVREGAVIQYQEFVVIGNEDEGHLLQLISVKNALSGTSSDRVKFKDIFSREVYVTSWTSEGVGTIDIGGKSYDVSLKGAHTSGTEDYEVRLNYPDSSGAGVAVIYPTIETSLGAKVMFYEPKTIDVSSWDGDGTALTTLRFPDGDGYMDVDVSNLGDIEVGELVFNLRKKGDNLLINLRSVKGDIISQPAVVILEEEDNKKYNNLIVTFEGGFTSEDGIGVSKIISTSEDLYYKPIKENSKLDRATTSWGSIVTIDSTDSDQRIAAISYPDEKVKDVDSKQKIVSITGASENYVVLQDIKLLIETLEEDGTIPTKAEGWNIQYYTYKVGKDGEYLKEYAPTGHYNADYSEVEGWKIDYWAPSVPGKYYTKIILYCSKENRGCSRTNSQEWKEVIYFEVVGEDGEPDDFKPIEMKLNKGWNLVNLALVWELFDTENEEKLYDMEIWAAFGYDKENENYNRFHPFRENEKIDTWYKNVMKDSNSRATAAYSSMWIYSNKKQTLKLGRITELQKELEKLVMSNVIFPKGWNFGSITEKMIDEVWDRMKGSCNPRKPGFVSWDSENQKWEVRSKDYLQNTAFKDSELYSGFVFNADEECKLRKRPPVPTLPEI